MGLENKPAVPPLVLRQAAVTAAGCSRCGPRTRVSLGGDVRQGRKWQANIHPPPQLVYLYVYSYSWAIGPCAVGDAFSVIGKTESRAVLPLQPTEKDCGAQVTKDWQGRVLNHHADAGNESRVSSLVLVKMTLPLTLGIKWIVGSPINTSLKGLFSGCFKTVDEMI